MAKTPAKKTTKQAAPRKRTAAPTNDRAETGRPAAVDAAASAPREKRVRGEFALPRSDYALIAKLKATAKDAGRPTKKNQLLRAGLRALAAMDGTALVAALAALPARERTKKPG